MNIKLIKPGIAFSNLNCIVYNFITYRTVSSLNCLKQMNLLRALVLLVICLLFVIAKKKEEKDIIDDELRDFLAKKNENEKRHPTCAKGGELCLKDDHCCGLRCSRTIMFYTRKFYKCFGNRLYVIIKY